MLLLEVDARLVVAGWLPLILILLLGVAIAALFLNMRVHLRRGNQLPTEADLRAQANGGSSPQPTTAADTED
jgi:hypothetical protein